jgi:hypothetical protein
MAVFICNRAQQANASYALFPRVPLRQLCRHTDALINCCATHDVILMNQKSKVPGKDTIFFFIQEDDDDDA